LSSLLRLSNTLQLETIFCSVVKQSSGVHGAVAWFGGTSAAVTQEATSGLDWSHSFTNCLCCLLQLRVLDFMALSLGMVASLRPAAKQLQPKCPPQGLCSLKNYVLVLETVLVSSASMAAVLVLLAHQPWFKGGNGQNIQVIAALSGRACVAHILR